MTDPVLEQCRGMIRDGSKSFYAASKLFDPPTRDSVYMLYAWCRYCDDQVDLQDLGRGGPTTNEADAGRRLESLEQRTRAALAGESDEHPAFQGLQRVVGQHRIPASDALALLEGFRMDVEGRRYPALEDVLLYCFHVAGVVGVMMARIMGVEDEPTLDRATDLGLAFQLTNIARDVVDDAVAGRLYLPLVWLEEAGVPEAEIAAPQHAEARFEIVSRLLSEADRYYDSSLVGVSRLRFRHAWAIAAARLVYRDIGNRIRARGPRGTGRAFVSKQRKLALVLGSSLQAARAVSLPRRDDGARPGLWTRPREVAES